MSPARGASTLARLFPVEAYPVIVPVVTAGALFSWMMARTIVSDPDSHSSARAGVAGIDDKSAESRGEGWRGSIRNYFGGRISSNAISIFPNKV